MKMEIENKEVNDKILKIWKSYNGDEGTKLYPLLYPNFSKKCKILFVGINPSFTEQLKKEQNYKFPNKDFDFDKDINREKDAKNKNSLNPYRTYFSVVWNIVEECKLNHDEWDHIDLFLVRDTTQKVIEDLVKDSESKQICNSFGNAQIELFLDILNEINPKVVIVINKFASEIINQNEKFEIDDSKFKEKGFDTIRINNKNIPLFFSGYLGSGRLDYYSKRRFIWHIKRALEE